MANEGAKRQTAVKIPLSEIANSRYVKAGGEWEPNYIITPAEIKASRINIIGAIIEKDSNNQFIIDDGSGRITVRSFEEPAYFPEVGEVVVLIGRPREFSGQIFIAPEIIKPIKKNKEKWLELRRLELNKQYKANNVGPQNTSEKEEAAITEEVKSEGSNIFDKVVESIRAQDTGEGAEMEKIIEHCGESEKDVENVINNLLMDGEAFEIRPGKIKLLD
ncbi:MAG: hypothetical protein ACOCQG_02705 [Candidatus Nanoarchaeia archaeon]